MFRTNSTNSMNHSDRASNARMFSCTSTSSENIAVLAHIALAVCIFVMSTIIELSVIILSIIVIIRIIWHNKIQGHSIHPLIHTR